MQLFDTHAHITDKKFDGDRQELIDNFEKDNVIGMIEAGTDIANSKIAAKLAEENNLVYAAAGVHPHNANETAAEFIDELKILAKIKPFLSQVLIPNLNVDRAIKILAQKSGVEEKKIKHLFSKYKINKLLTVSSDTSQIVAEQNVHKSNLNNLEEFVIKQYEEI